MLTAQSQCRLFNLLDRFEHPGGGVGHDDIQTSVAAAHLVEEGGQTVLVGQIGANRQTAPALALDFSDHLTGIGPVPDIIDHHLSPLSCQPLGHSPANPP